MDGNINYIFTLSREEETLALAEIVSLFSVVPQLLFNKYYLLTLSLDEKKVSEISKRLSYTRAVLVRRDIFSTLDSIDFTSIKNSYKLHHSVFKNNKLTTKELADKLYVQLKNPVVDVHNPDHEYMFLEIEEEIWLLEFIYINKDKINERRAHKKEKNHPTGMDPKLAKAMINLAGTSSFIDPFCGAGGLLIEGALMGLNVRGSDISYAMVDRANANLKAFNLSIDLEIKDALTISNKTEAIVTDLPYGRNSSTSKETNKLYKDFFKIAQKVTHKLIVGMMSSTQHEQFIEGTNWKLEQSFKIYVHKSLSRKILVLTTNL